MLLKVIAISFLMSCPFSPVFSQKNYYFSSATTQVNGTSQDGSLQHPFSDPGGIKDLRLMPGDTLFFKTGTAFIQPVVLDNIHGTVRKKIVFTSYGPGKAVIFSGNTTGLLISNSSHFEIVKLAVNGSGRKEGNTTDGIKLFNCASFNLMNIDVSGFQKAGLLLFNCRDGTVDSIVAHENGFAGILVDGDYQQRLSERIHIVNSKADNNPGDPTNLTNHSGNGILAGNCRNVLIEYCSATHNGWDMPRIGNGPVGIWAYEADSVIIQYCISYGNKTAKGAADGGGFDLDGGVTNSVIQYCLSYDNEGSGYGIYQYWSASRWKNNRLQHCISINDGRVTENASAMYIWNGNNGDSSFTDFYAQHNFFYNDQKYAFSFSGQSQHRRFTFSNNYFIASDTSDIYYGIDSSTSDVFSGNVWMRKSGGFMQDGYNDLGRWAAATGYEMQAGKLVGRSIDKRVVYFRGAIHTTDPHQLFNDTQLQAIWKLIK